MDDNRRPDEDVNVYYGKNGRSFPRVHYSYDTTKLQGFFPSPKVSSEARDANIQFQFSAATDLLQRPLRALEFQAIVTNNVTYIIYSLRLSLWIWP